VSQWENAWANLRQTGTALLVAVAAAQRHPPTRPQAAHRSQPTDRAVREKRRVPARHSATAVRNTDGAALRPTTVVLVAILRLELAQVVVRPRLRLLPQRRFRRMVAVERRPVLEARLVTAVRSMGGVGLRLIIVGLDARVRLGLVIRG
jgi:hypothetical protein